MTIENSEKIGRRPDLKRLRAWVAEAHYASQDWRAESWRDCEMYDGQQWDEVDYEAAKAAGIEALTINKTFPTVGIILGSQILNKLDIMALGRTKDDTEMGQVMTEGIKFVLDQYDGEFLISGAFHDQCIPGIGYLNVGLNPDPRREKIKVATRDWKEIFQDPFGDPWIHPDQCKYVFHQKWMDIENLIASWPERETEIRETFQSFAEVSRQDLYSGFLDEATEVEEERSFNLGGPWTDTKRKRVRPVEMWYSLFQKGMYAVFPDGRVWELKDSMNPMEQYEIVKRSQEVVTANVRKIQVATFLGNLLLQDVPSPHSHDLFPFIPFIGYLDRFKFPYGVPRQIRGQNIEVNKRRSMALALLKARRVIAEEDVVDGGGEDLQKLYEEANKLDGFVVVAPGGIEKIKIIEQAQLAPSQMALLEQSEQEIAEISGQNQDRSGIQTNAVSGEAIRARQKAGAVMTATLFDNLRRSLKRTGSLVVSSMQDYWKQEKVLRITDRLSGARRFVVLNETIQDETGTITVRHDVTQAVFDIVIAESPQDDTIRAKNVEMIIEWVKKSPPEIIPHLLNLMFELSDIPNKEQLLMKLKPLMGINPQDEDLSPEEIKQRVIQELEAKQKEMQHNAELEEQAKQLALEKARLENQKLQADIDRIASEARVGRARAVADIQHRKNEMETVSAKTGAEVVAKGAKAERDRLESMAKVQDSLTKAKQVEQAANKPETAQAAGG